MEDKDIVRLYLARDEAAIAETRKKYGRYCHFIAARITGDDQDAEEIVNDTYLKTWNTVPPNRPDPLKGYLGKISNRLALDRYNSKKAAKRGGGQLPAVLHELSECIPTNDNREDIGYSVALRDALGRFLKALPERTRTIFVRRYWYVTPITEIAEEFGMKESNVAMLMLRTRLKLKAFLEKEGLGNE